MAASTPAPGERGTRTAAIVGLGVSGRAAADLLRDSGYRTVGFDQRQLPEEQLSTGLDDVITRSEPAALADEIIGLQPEIVVVSPGIRESSELIAKPRAAGLRVIGEVQLAWDLSHATSDTAWLSVTGTNGKTTTVGMLESILRAGGVRAAAVGNIGYPIATAAFEGLDAMAVELSSFQLVTSPDLHPLASICLNIDSDHLDWHGDRESYARAKGRVYDGTKMARFYFEDEPETRALAASAVGADSSTLIPLTFGSVPDGAIGIVNGRAIDRSPLRRGTSDQLADFSQIRLLAAATNTSAGAKDAMVRDALAAVALAHAYGVSPRAIQEGLADFQPDQHRREDLGTHHGVRWINDSKATNVHAAVAAARALTAKKTIWIMGGDDKDQDLRPLAQAAREYAKAAVILGADSVPLQELLEKEAPDLRATSIHRSGSNLEMMEDAVRACADFASPGDTVLLAPGCASWDQFASYTERGELFRQAVKEIYTAKGK